MVEIYRAGEQLPPKKPSRRQQKKVAQEMTNRNWRQLHSLLKKKSGPLATAFIAYPRGVNFESQGDDEKIILLVRRHWITNLRWLFLALILALAPLLLFNSPLLTSFPPRLRLGALMLWYLLVLAFVIQQGLDWLFNVGIVTNQRVVDIDFFNLIHKRISDAEIRKIQDVTVNINGTLRTLFNYGSVFIQTASERPEISFENIPKPALVARVLEVLQGRQRQ